jgi:hypothetical protein
MREIADSDLTLTDIPTVDATWENISKFALTYSGYEVCGSFEACADIANAQRHESLADLRTCLFFEQRRWRHFGYDPDDETMVYIRGIVKQIREYVAAGRNKSRISLQAMPKPVATLSSIFRFSQRIFSVNLLSIVLLTLVVNIPINAVLEFSPLPENAGLDEWSRYFRIQQALQFWIGTVGIMGVVHLTVSTFRGVRLSLGEIFGRVFEDYGRALWTQFLYNLAFVIGLLLVVIPGLIIGVFWCFSLQAIVVHNVSGLQALKHSYQVVKGRWWKFFGRLVTLYLLYFVGIMFLSVPSYFVPETHLFRVLYFVRE